MNSLEVDFDDKGELKFNLFELLRHLPKEAIIPLMEEYSCLEVVIRHVTDQILDGLTENAYSGGGAVTHMSQPYLSLDYARREIAKRSGEVAERVISDLERSLKSREDLITQLQQDLFERRS